MYTESPKAVLMKAASVPTLAPRQAGATCAAGEADTHWLFFFRRPGLRRRRLRRFGAVFPNHEKVREDLEMTDLAAA